MNIFNIRAENAGKAFIYANPNATGIQIEDAATKHCPTDPGRRHFIDAARWKQAELHHTTIPLEL